jgi:hypothetical protein
MGDVLTRVGRFAPSDVHVLLEPTPAEITGVLDAVAKDVASTGADETLFVFYYSGHSDGQALYPHGEAMTIGDLRDRLARIDARVRVGILDTCRGGTWTQTKGLTIGPPLHPADLAALATEGTALVASSSGVESAHEAEAVQGSFFTHHFAAGLLGAADRSGDGNITLQEAFDYAKERTVRDSARYAPVPQHPSFDLQLRGRQDLVLSQVASSPSALDLAQTRGPLEVIHLTSGMTVLEAPAGQRRLRLALVPGRYLVRRVDAERIYAKEVDVVDGGTTIVAEEQLELTGSDHLAMKGDDEPKDPLIFDRSTLPARWFELRVAAGVAMGPARSWGRPAIDTKVTPNDGLVTRSFSSLFAFTYAITDRLTWQIPLPAVAYRFGEPGSVEVIPRLGLSGLGFSSLTGLIAMPDAGVTVRAWTRDNQSVIAGVSATSRFSLRTSSRHAPSPPPTTWALVGTAGYAWTIRRSVSIHLGAGITRDVHLGEPVSYVLVAASPTLLIGSVLSIGYQPLPLVQVHLSPAFSLDAYASWGINLRNGSVHDQYLAGVSWSF